MEILEYKKFKIDNKVRHSFKLVKEYKNKHTDDHFYMHIKDINNVQEHLNKTFKDGEIISPTTTKITSFVKLCLDYIKEKKANEYVYTRKSVETFFNVPTVAIAITKDFMKIVNVDGKESSETRVHVPINFLTDFKRYTKDNQTLYREDFPSQYDTFKYVLSSEYKGQYNHFINRKGYNTSTLF